MGFDVQSGISGAVTGGMIGGPAGAGIGFLGGGLLGGNTPDAPQVPNFNPMSVYGPLGKAEFRGGGLRLALSPEMMNVQKQLFASMAGGPTNLSPAQQQLIAQSTMAGNNLFGMGNQAAQMGQGFLQSAGTTDPNQIASEQFSRMQALLAPQREQAMLGQENRLLRQGLLTSSGGARQMGELFKANRMQDLSLANQALQQGLDTQGQLFSRGLTGLQAGAGLYGTGIGFLQAPTQQEQLSRQNYMQSLAGIQGLGQGLFNQANLGMRGGEAQAGINQFNASGQYMADQTRADQQNALLFGGLQSLSGMNFGGGGGSMGGFTQPSPQLFMQNPYGNSSTGLNFNPTGGIF